MSCELELWQHGSKTGRRAYFSDSDDGDPMTTQMDQVNDEDTSAQVTGDCAWVIMEHPEGRGGGGFIVDPGEYVPNLGDSNHHGEGKGSTNHRFYRRGDRVNRVIRLTPPTDGYYDDIDIYFKRADTRTGQWGHFPWVTEDLLANPNDSNQLITSTTDKGQPCPGAAKASIIGHRRYRCTYNTEAQITNLKSGIQGKTGGDPRLVMYNNIVQKFCDDTDNTFKAPGGTPCHEVNTGRALAIEYCSVGSRIKGGTTGGDPNCTTEALGDNYDSIAEAYCEANPNDSFCSCYNVVNDKCADDSTTGPAGCDHKSGEAYVNNRKATPSDQKSLWDGQRKCGSVCTGADKYLPDNNQAGCKTTIQICSQNFNVNNMSNSDISAKCELNASDGSSVGDSPSTPSPAQESAQTEVEEAEAAVARGDPGAQERLDAAREALEAADEDAEETGLKAYIPKSLDGLKNNQKQQIGAGVTGALILGCMMMLLLLVVGASGGGGGPVKRRFR